MATEFPKLNLEKYSHGYEAFYQAAIHILVEAENFRVLKYILTDDMNSQYKYSDEFRAGYLAIHFLKQNYLVSDKEIFLSFLNEILPEILKYSSKQSWELDNINPNLKTVIYKLVDLIAESNNSSVFNLDFYYDSGERCFRRKLDVITTESINLNRSELDGENKTRYEECVSDFLSYKRDLTKDNKLFYNESLNNLKKVVENSLHNNYKKEDGSFPMIHKKKELSNILFDNSSIEFENLIEYVTKNIHHEAGGQPKVFTEKEYIYLWMELNTILYLLNRYKK